jgi:hypothetical protein
MRHRSLTLGALGLAAAGAAALAPQAVAWPASATCTGIELHEDGTHSYVIKAPNGAELASGTYTDESGVIPITVPSDAKKVRVIYDGKTAEDYPVTGAPCEKPPPPPVTPPVNVPPGPHPLTPTTPPPPPTCSDLLALYPKAGKARIRSWEAITGESCLTTTPPPPPPRKRQVCERPAKLRIVQQQTGTFYTQTYPLRVIIANTTGAATPKGALVLTDSGLQNFVAPDGSRTERLVVPVGPMRKGQVRSVERTMGFVGVEAFREVFTTYATFHVRGRICGYALDRAFEG